MTSTTAAAKVVVLAVQAMLALFQTYLAPGSYLCPSSTDVATAANKSYDMVIVGGGTTGSAMAYRVAKENPNITIAVIEEGTGCSPIESMMSGLFTLLPNSSWDRAYNIENDTYSCQNILPGALTAGIGLGGSSILNHMISVSYIESDYIDWGVAANDSTWSNMGEYFVIGETVTDEEVVNENATMHGTSGPRVLSRQISTYWNTTISALIEKGYEYVCDAVSAYKVNYPLLSIGSDCRKMRQSSVESYLSQLVGNDKVTFITGVTANKIIFDNKTATGVQVISGEDSYIIQADKLITLTLGALRTPQILMTSGVGNKTHLNEKNITVLQDNPYVGENLMDHPGMMFTICLQDSTTTASSDLYEWPVPLLTSYGGSVSGGIIDYQAIMLGFPPNASGNSQLCGTGFKYTEAICDSLYGCCGNKNQMVVVMSVSHPKSRGRVTLNSNSMTDSPHTELGLYSNEADLETMVESVMEFTNILNTTVFQEMGATLCDAGVCTEFTKGSYEFWECYAIAMSSTMWHYSGTCALGTVVDKNLLVKDFNNLMICDTSVFPSISAANIETVAYAVAEKAAEIALNILKDQENTDQKDKTEVFQQSDDTSIFPSISATNIKTTALAVAEKAAEKVAKIALAFLKG